MRLMAMNRVNGMTALLTATMLTTTACLAGEPGPTRVPPAGSSQLELAWNNMSDEPFFVGVSQGVLVRGYATVEPCSASSMTMFVSPPFEIGIGSVDADVTRPLPPIAESDDFPDSDDEYRVLVVIAPDGTRTVQPLLGDPLVRPDIGC